MCDALAALPLSAFWDAGEALPGALGRGGVRVLRLGGVVAVVRRYRRGGALRRFLPDRFLSPDRAFRELELSVALRADGLPIPEPLAALARRTRCGFELAIATRLVANARPLPAFVAEQPGLRRATLRAAGALVARAFAVGLQHPDLHPGNVLARRSGNGEPELVLIDLDRARRLPRLTPAQQDAMLVRMARWLWRHARELPSAPRTRDFAEFLRGMGLGGRGRRAEHRRLARLVQRALRWRKHDR